MDPGPAFRVQEVESHAFRAHGGEELDRNGGQPREGCRDSSARAAWGFLDTRIRLALDAQSSIASRTSLDLSPVGRKNSNQPSGCMLIDMMQAPEHRLPNDPIRRVGRGRRSCSARRPLVEPTMGTPRIEVGDVLVQRPLEMALVDDEQMIQSLSQDRPEGKDRGSSSCALQEGSGPTAPSSRCPCRRASDALSFGRVAGGVNDAASGGTGRGGGTQKRGSDRRVHH
jgi:hypothetical protein